MLQQEVAELWMGLALQHMCGPGTLFLCQHSGDRSLALPLACIGSGGAVLMLASEKPEALQASKGGAVDFIVDTLSEALRILKNELRQRRSVAVALVGPVERNVAAMEERGVQPQFVETVPDRAALWGVLVQRGAVPVVCEDVKENGLASAVLEQLSVEVQVVAQFADRRAADENLLEALSVVEPGPAQAAAQRWMSVAPRLFPRDRDRVFWRYNDEESAR